MLVFTALLVVSGIVSVNLWRELRTEQLNNEALRSQLAKSSSVSQAPATSVSPATTAQLVAAPPPAAVPEAHVAGAKLAPPPIESEVIALATTAAILAGSPALTGGVSERDLLRDPEYRKAQLTQACLRLALGNPGLVETLGLSRTEAEHLFAVMAETQLSRSDDLSEALAKAGGIGNASASTAEILRNAVGREDPARAALGEAKYAQYQEYVRNLRPALTQVANIGSTLDAVGQPLSDSQTRSLTVAMVTEQQRLRQEAAIPRPIPNPGVPRGVADTLTESANRQQESNRRILVASAATLDAVQFEILKQQFEQQDATRRRSIETAREMDARRVTLPQPATPPTKTP